MPSSFIDKIEHIYISFLNMNTKDVVERLYSNNFDINDRKRLLSRILI